MRRAILVVGVGYPVALVAVAVALRFVGEGWSVTALALYVPRIVFATPLPFVIGASVALGLRPLAWLQLTSTAILLFALMGLTLPRPHSADPGAPRLRVLSYNVNSSHGGVDNIVDEIDRFSPDVVLLQEIGDPEAIAALLRSRYPTVDVSTDFLVASRYPISSSFDPGKLPYGGRSRSPRFVQRVLDTPLGRIVFYNVHPISPREAFVAVRGRGLSQEIPSGRLLRGAGAPVIEENFGLRLLQVQTFTEAAARESGPVVIAGDTNLPDASNIFGRYLSSYRDGFTRAGWGFGYTFPTGKHYPWMRIDRVLSNDRLRFIGFQVGQSSASDHLCVVADIQREKP